MTIDRLSRQDLGALLHASDSPCLSLFLPTARAGQETLQNPIRWKNLVREADRKLEARGWNGDQRRKWLQPVADLVDDFYFWQHQSDGLAAFRNGELFRLFRVPSPMPESVVLSERFQLKPLLPLIGSEAGFYVLAVSQTQARLYRATRHTMEELDGEALPRDLRQAMSERLPERQLQSHTVSAAGTSRAIFHGHNAAEEDRKEMLLPIFRMVDAGVRTLLRGEDAPLLLAAVDYLHPIYKQANTYPHLVAGRIRGNPEEMGAAELHSRAVSAVEPLLDEQFQAAAGQFGDLLHGGRATNKLGEVVLAALTGRVAALFLASGVAVWGRVNLESLLVHVHQEPREGDEDLLNSAALHAWSSGAKVFVVPRERVPGGEPQAAILRY